MINMQPFKLLIFDWDGTLADTIGPIVKALQYAFQQHQLPIPEAHAIRQLIGYNLTGLIASLQPSLSEATCIAVARSYSDYFLNPNHHVMHLFDEVIPCLETLQQQGYWLAVATGKGRTELDLAIAQTNTTHFWLTTRCASECVSKPSPDMIFQICNELGVYPNQSLVLGDTTHDLLMAANAGAAAIALNTGAHSAEKLQSAPHLTLLNTLAALPTYLQTLSSTA